MLVYYVVVYCEIVCVQDYCMVCMYEYCVVICVQYDVVYCVVVVDDQCYCVCVVVCGYVECCDMFGQYVYQQLFVVLVWLLWCVVVWVWFCGFVEWLGFFVV